MSTPLGTTSTDTMDTKQAQEFSKEIAEAVIERELKKQKYEQYQQAKQTSRYQVPKSITIPVPDLNKPRQEKANRPTSVLSNFDLPVYEELGDPKEEQQKGHSRSMTPGLVGIKYGEGAIPKDSSKGKPTFQDYTSKMMSALNNPWKPRSKKTATPTRSAVPPLVYVSTAETPVDDTGSKQAVDEKYVPVNLSAVDKTVLTPQGGQEMGGIATPINFTKDLQNGDALRVNPQGGALMEALGFGPDKVEERDPDFYMPDGQGRGLSEIYQMFTNEKTPKGNPGVIVKLTNLVKKHGSPFYLMDKKSGHLYVLNEQGYTQIEEKGLLYPSESMIIAGALDENKGNPFMNTQSNRLPGTPAAESTRVPLKTSTDKREVREKKEPLTPEGLLEREQTEWYQKELKEAEEDMMQAYLEKSKLENEEVEMIKQRALRAQEEFAALEQMRNENRKIHDKMKEEIEKMDQAIADSSSFIKKMKSKDPQQVAYEKTISDFWNTSDVPSRSLLVKIAFYPSLESLNEEPKKELTEAEYEYYDKKRARLIEKMAIANDMYMAHLQNFVQEGPKEKSQKFLFQFNELGHQLHRQFDIVAEWLKLPYEQPLMTYPSLGDLMDVIQREDMENKNREYFWEMAKEVKVKDDIAQKVLNNRLSVVKTPQEKDKACSHYDEYQKESRKLLNFCEKMMEKREKEIDSLELEQPEGVPEVKEISKEKLDEKLRDIIDQPQYVEPIGKNTLPPHYSREISRYEPPKPVKKKEREDLIKKVKEMTGEEIKGGRREESVEVDTDLSWDHEGLKPLPKAPRNRLDESPKPPRVPKAPRAKTDAEETSKKGYSANGGDVKEGKYSEIPSRMKESKKETSPEIKQDADPGKRSEEYDKKLNLESHDDPVDKKTARWIEEQNEFMEKHKEREVPIFKPNGPVKVLQKQKATRHTGYERPPQPLMGARGGQAPQLPMIVTNQRNGSWGSQGKRYPLKERFRNQWGGYGKQYGAGNERRGYQTYGTDRTPLQNHNTAYGLQRQGSYVPTQSTRSGQGGNGRNGDENDKKKYKDTRSSQESNSHKESDTEDSYEFEITSQQLSQVDLDTTGLENSFDQFGRTMFEVLNAQHRTNQKLEEQFHRANETQEYQAEAMQDMAQANFQMKYDHMFAGVPMYDGTDPDTFDDWLYQIESLCELSRRDVRVELMGQASAQVKRIIRSLPLDIDWEIAQRELKRCLTEEKSRAHSAFKLAQIKQKPNKNLRIFILRYQDLHSAVTGKTAAEDTDPTHIIRFLGMMTNSEIARKITQKGIPEGMTLGQAFTRAIELEAGYQLSEGVSLARPPEIMQVQGIEEIDEVAAMQNRFKDVVCWGCGEKGHLYRDWPHRRENVHDVGYDDSNEYAGKSEQVIRITQPITVATRDNIYRNMATQRTRANLYKAGYKRTKAALQKQQKINAAMSTTLAAQNPTVTTQTITTTSPKVVQPKTVKTQMTQNPNTTTQVVQVPTTPGATGVGNVPN